MKKALVSCYHTQYNYGSFISGLLLKFEKSCMLVSSLDCYFKKITLKENNALIEFTDILTQNKTKNCRVLYLNPPQIGFHCYLDGAAQAKLVQIQWSILLWNSRITNNAVECWEWQHDDNLLYVVFLMISYIFDKQKAKSHIFLQCNQMLHHHQGICPIKKQLKA